MVLFLLLMLLSSVHHLINENNNAQLVHTLLPYTSKHGLACRYCFLFTSKYSMLV